MRYYQTVGDREHPGMALVLCSMSPDATKGEIVAEVPGEYAAKVREAIERAYQRGRVDLADELNSQVQKIIATGGKE